MAMEMDAVHPVSIMCITNDDKPMDTSMEKQNQQYDDAIVTREENSHCGVWGIGSLCSMVASQVGYDVC